mgnify:CR=1 FL=1
MRFPKILVAPILIFSMGVSAVMAAPAPLAEYLSDVYRHNPEIAAAQKAAEAAGAQAKSSWALDDPVVGATYYKVPVTGGLGNAMDQMWTVSQTIP